MFGDSPWGQHYLRQAEDGHPFYSAARFFTREEFRAVLVRAGLVPVRFSSTLRQASGEAVAAEPVWPEDHPDAGFSAWLAVSRTDSGG